MSSFPRWLVLVLPCLLLVVTGGRARASPRGLSAEDATDDLTASGDIDAEDLVGRATRGRTVAPRTLGGGAWVSLGAFTRRVQTTGQREVGGLLVVRLPFDRVARRTSTHETSFGDAGLVNASSVAAPGEADGPALTARVARNAVAAAWRAASLAPDDARLDGIVSRARWSSLLPEARLRATRYDDQRLSTDASTDTSRLKDSTAANVGLEARLTWRFDRLLYADDEPAFERLRLEHHDARMRIAARTLEALFQWNRAWVELRYAQAASREAREAPGRPSRDEVEAALRVTEAEATLDVLTGGWFTSARAKGFVVRPGASSGSAL